METFFIFYGVIEALNSIYVYKGKNRYALYITFVWGLSFVFVGLVELFKLFQPWNVLAYILFGTSWFPMMFTPCGISIFRVNKISMFIRKLVFCVIGIVQLISLIV